MSNMKNEHANKLREWPPKPYLDTRSDYEHRLLPAADYIDRLESECAELVETLEWYAEKARSLKDKPFTTNPDYVEAIFVELSLDGGKRADAVLSKYTNL